MAQQLDMFADYVPDGSDNAAPRILYFDLETQKSAEEVGGWGNSHLMRLAVGVVWDSREKAFFTYFEAQAEELVKKLLSADLVVGFNIVSFDYAVLQPYANKLSTPVDLQEVKSCDMLVDVKKKLGIRIKLNDLAAATLNAEKSADGLVSLQWFKEGKLTQIAEYCQKDVEITRDLFLSGLKNGHVFYEDKKRGPQKLPIEWKTVRGEPVGPIVQA